MTREDYLHYCNSCTNKGFDPQKGMICKLSQNLPNFTLTCSSYVEDPKIKQQEEYQAYAKSISDTSDPKEAKNDLLVGGAICAIGIVLTLSSLGVIFYGAILYGGYRLVRGLVSLG